MIRKMTLKDIDEVYALEKEIFKDPWTKDMFIQEVSDNSLASTYVLEDDNKIVGYAGMWKLFENADITNIAVKKEYRGKGYGKLLLETLLNECKKQGSEYVHLEVRVSNEVAISLYKSYGFEIINIRKSYYEDLNILSSVVTSQIDVHARFGGVIPEVASRMHVEQISTIVESAVNEAGITVDEVDAIAYTIGPGLIGSLHIGSVAAKTLAFFYNKPLIGVHHLKGHIFINELIKPLNYPMLALVVSGGHTELVRIEDENSFKIIGTTLDDAVGESYDKVARVIGLEYPGGPKIDKLSKEGKKHYELPTPKVDGLNFSFSGLKNATLQLAKKIEQSGEELNKADYAYAFQEVALKTLVNKSLKALEEYPDTKTFVLAGGVACNSRLRELMEENIKGVDLILPPLKYCTDNATMIAVAGMHYLKNNKFVPLNSSSNPSMSIED